jgi:hypothetical protein
MSFNSEILVSDLNVLKSDLLIEDKVEGDRKKALFKFDLHINPNSTHKITPEGANISLEKFDSFTRIHLTVNLIVENDAKSLNGNLTRQIDTKSTTESTPNESNPLKITGQSLDDCCHANQENVVSIELSDFFESFSKNENNKFKTPDTPTEMLKIMKSDKNMRNLFSKIRCIS